MLVIIRLRMDQYHCWNVDHWRWELWSAVHVIMKLTFSSTDVILLSTHADRQGVDISFTVCVFLCVCVCVCLYVCTVTDFSAEDKASGVKFCTAVLRRPMQGISHFLWLLLFKKPKIGWICERSGHAHCDVNITVEMHRCNCHARDAPFVESRDVWM